MPSCSPKEPTGQGKRAGHDPAPSPAAQAALLAAALADGTSQLANLPANDEVQLLIDALRGLGVRIRIDPAAGHAVVQGCGGHIPEGEAELYCGRWESVAKASLAVSCLGQGRYRLTGEAAAGDWSLDALAAWLQRLGAQIAFPSAPDTLPAIAHARGLRGGTLRIETGDIDALAALLVVAPYARSDVFLDLAQSVVEQIEHRRLRIVLDVMEAFGVAVVEQRMTRFIVAAPQRYQARPFVLES